ncbi:unnamed protein product, partial [Linum tenue]
MAGCVCAILLGFVHCFVMALAYVYLCWLCFFSLDKETAAPDHLKSNELASLHSLMADLANTQLTMKREFEESMNSLRVGMNSLRDLLLSRLGDNVENVKKERKDDVVEVVNISSDNSFSLSARSKPKMTSTATKRKGKVVLKSPVRVRSPILTRQDTERRGSAKQVIGPFISTQHVSKRDKLLIRHAFDQSKDASEVLVKSPWFHLNRAEFKLLLPETWLSTQIMTMCTDLLTL